MSALPTALEIKKIKKMHLNIQHYDKNLLKLVEKHRQQDDNYEFYEGFNNKNLIIYFSSNGLFFPDTSECFLDKIGNRDKYEWKKFHCENFAGVNALFVRDVYKLFYLFGLNNKIDTFEKLEELVIEFTNKFQNVTLVGVSSGGYAALRIATKFGLNAIVIGAQRNIKYLRNDKKYSCIQSVKSTYSSGKSSKVYAIYSIFSLQDIRQLTKVWRLASVKLVFRRSHGFVPKTKVSELILSFLNKE